MIVKIFSRSRRRLFIRIALCSCGLWSLACKPGGNDGDLAVTSEHVDLARDTARIGLLSKYDPRRLRLTGTGQVYRDGGAETLRGPLLVEARSEKELALHHAGRTVLVDHLIVRGVALSVEVLAGDRAAPVRRTYTGALEFEPGGPSLVRVVNVLPVERYVWTVARGETGATPELDANERAELLRAMRTVVRSYYFAHPDRHPEGSHEFCDLTHCMVFPGQGASIDPPAGARLDPALGPTDGRESTGAREEALILTDARGDFFPAYFSSTCGGLLAAPASLWPADRSDPRLFRVGPDRLPGEADDLCRASPHYRWSYALRRDVFAELLFPDERGLRTTFPRLERQAGRVSAFVAEGRRVPTAEFLSRAGRRLGWNAFKSNLFEIEAGAGLIAVRGRGLGHGIGLCQWGARRQAARGRRAFDILRFYYPEARIARGRYRRAGRLSK